jgi:ABC-type multidrug transport system permease subunit
MADPIDYAPYLGIRSEAAAIVFAVLYLPLLVYFAFRAIRWRTWIYIVLALFCASKCFISHVKHDAEECSPNHVLLHPSRSRGVCLRGR